MIINNIIDFRIPDATVLLHFQSSILLSNLGYVKEFIPLEVQTTRFGKITVEESGVITFPGGLPGFADQKLYALIDVTECSPLKWLQSLEVEWLAFVLLDPTEFLEEYSVQIDSGCVAELDLSSSEEAMVYVIVTASEEPQDMTANLQAPIVLNPAKQLAKQIVLMNSGYSVRHPILRHSE